MNTQPIMADSKPLSDTTEEDALSLIDCGICLAEMEKPKALPCLHSFCLKCLKRVAHPPGSFICPLCQEKIPLPPAGVDGFRDNFFINQLKERKAIFTIGKVIMPCACCGTTDQQVAARCMDCNGFLCQQCVHSHKTLAPLKLHTVFTLDELRSGTVDTSKVMKEECCQKHKDQVLRWYCKTCDIPICRDCTVMEHTRPEHDYVTIESAVKGHLEEIKNLVTACEGISRRVNTAITKVDKVRAKLDGQLSEASKRLKDEESKAKEAFLKALQENVKTTTDQLNTIKMERYEKIEDEKTNLQHMKSKLSNALEMANQVMKSGSTHDVASNYSTLCKTLTQLKEIKTAGINHSLSAVKFTPSQMGSVEHVNLGTVSSTGPNPRDKNGKWVLEKEIGKEGQGKIKNGFGVAVDPNTTDIVIADDGDKNIKVSDSDGNYKRVLEGVLHQPHDVAVSSDGFHFITDCTAHVKVFSPDGTYLKQFPAISPDGKSSDTDGSILFGITIDSDGNLLVGSSKNCISKHKQDGTHISTIKTNIRPWFIGMTSQGKIVVCANIANTNAQIMDHMGNLLHSINTPHDAKSLVLRPWRPCGVCCKDDGIIYVSNYEKGGQGGIYSFTEDGEYLGCVTTDVTEAEGIALIDNDTLVVVQHGHPAKIFSYLEN
ncbi:E3 ubiquitin-protein ligase TRIM45-like [Amphiura filiformis]|uniref:E3 ubiquitin-protein ligase TRIM45-like n=1 Tax=Amphiura filiformis TaxID=82378 RepID=UPI003B219B43